MAATKQPADKSHFILPDLGEGVPAAELISWKVKPGEPVKEHQTMAEMETDKALVEVPRPWTGVIDEPRGSEGETISVGSTPVPHPPRPPRRGALPHRPRGLAAEPHEWSSKALLRAPAQQGQARTKNLVHYYLLKGLLVNWISVSA